MKKDGKDYGTCWRPVERGEKGFSVYTWACWRCSWKIKGEPQEICPRCKRTATEVFLCDPELNVTCSRSGCFLNGGDCRHTTRIEYARSAADVFRDKYAEQDREYYERQKTRSTKRR